MDKEKYTHYFVWDDSLSLSDVGWLTWVEEDYLWYYFVLACWNNKLSRYDAVNHSAKCKYYKYGNIDIVVRTPDSGIVLELGFYNIRLLHLIYDSKYKLLFHWNFYNTNIHLIKTNKAQWELIIAVAILWQKLLSLTKN